MPKNAQDVFDRSRWFADRMLLDDLVFRLEHYRSGTWDGGDHFRFYKIKELVDQYAVHFRRHPGYQPKRILELGIFDGGSVAFWHELFRPEKHVAVDLIDRKDSPYFQRYLASRDLSGRIATFWNTNQADQRRLRSIIASEFDGPIDLVIDDASHLYSPTLATFEAVFPLMSPGGIYIIEDWAWGHWPEFAGPDHAWARETPPTRLVVQLIEAAGTSSELIASIDVCRGFVAVERGPQVVADPESFTLEGGVFRRPDYSARRSLPTRIRALLARTFGFARSR